MKKRGRQYVPKANAWVSNAIGIEAQAMPTNKFNDKEKCNDPVKIAFNLAVAQGQKDLWRNWHGIVKDTRAIVLDGTHVRTTTVLATKGTIPLASIDVVSKTVWFRTKRGVKTGQLFSGEFTEFLQTLGVGKCKYAVIVLDEMGSPDDLICLSTMLALHQMADVAFCAITYSNRDGRHKKDMFKQTKLKVQEQMQKIADTFGYKCLEKGQIDHGSMFSLFYKFMHKEKMMTKGKQQLTADERDASIWLGAAVPGMSEILESVGKKANDDNDDENVDKRRKKRVAIVDEEDEEDEEDNEQDDDEEDNEQDDDEEDNEIVENNLPIRKRDNKRALKNDNTQWAKNEDRRPQTRSQKPANDGLEYALNDEVYVCDPVKYKSEKFWPAKIIGIELGPRYVVAWLPPYADWPSGTVDEACVFREPKKPKQQKKK